MKCPHFSVLLAGLLLVQGAAGQLPQQPALAKSASSPESMRQAPGLQAPGPPSTATQLDSLRAENLRLNRLVELQRQKIKLLEERLRMLEGGTQ